MENHFLSRSLLQYFVSRCCGWTFGFDFNFSPDLIGLIGYFFILHRNCYGFFFCRCGWQTTFSLDYGLLFSTSPQILDCRRCGCGKFSPSDRLSHFSPAVVEGRALCASTVAAAESVSFSDGLIFPLPILNSLCGAFYPLFLRRCKGLNSQSL